MGLKGDQNEVERYGYNIFWMFDSKREEGNGRS